jgi:AcrR family transcriptional regulator
MTEETTPHIRTRQKARTREALIAAARELSAEGTTPTVEQAAMAASISRATAYRYFSSQRALLLAAHPIIELPSLLGPNAPSDPEQRLDHAVRELTDLVTRHETELRTMLRLSLEDRGPQPSDLLLRQGRRIGWLEDALVPVRRQLTDREYTRLVDAIGAVVGIEALVWLTDIAGNSRSEAVETMRWAARGLLHAALARA